MAGWISSKLKVAESFLQQIDQQAAESLGKNEEPRSKSLNDEIRVKTEAIPLKDQLKKKTPEKKELNFEKPRRPVGKKHDSVVKYSPNPTPAIADGDWTELLGSPNQISPLSRPNGKSTLRTQKDSMKNGIAGLSPSWVEAKKNHKSNVNSSNSGKRLDVVVENKVNSEGSSPDGKPNDEESGLSGVLWSGGSDLSDSTQRKPSSDSQEDKGNVGEGGDNRISTSDNQLSEIKEDTRAVVILGEDELRLQDGMPTLRMVPVSGMVDGVADMEREVDDDNGEFRNAAGRDEAGVVAGSSVPRELQRSSSASDGDGRSYSETDSASTSDSENENERREEGRKRREQMLAEEAAAKAVEAIKERENIVARLEGEKQSLEKILEEREKQQAQEASELQMSMMETMEAVELEKQKHSSTRMEALTRLAELETKNAELARSLATTQRNLEVEVDRAAELRKQIELKEVAHEELRRRMSKIHASSLSQAEASKEVQFEREILEAEYSFINDKIGKLQEKEKKLVENIEMTRKEIEEPTEVEVELKKRLSKLTDHLIQKQAQVETLSSEKATLLFRLETAYGLLDENKLSTSTKDDIEACTWGPSSSRPRPLFQDRIQSGRRHLGSILRQLDAIFSAGVVFLRRNPAAQLWSLVYLICLHFWVLYILMSHSRASVETRSGAVFSLESINKTV
ncbi:golgin Putative 2 [Tasmannia lanceolata]|uniref:golgin Putative 2 n=1 Tax=Tasmannia lanceolata TaxID=3420 RepID=UPI0040633906